MNLSRRFSTILAGLTLAVAIIPQRGDPGADPVTHPEWARMMLRGLELEESLDYVASASRAFAALSWRQSGWLAADEHLPDSAQGVRLEPGRPALLRATAPMGEVSFPVTIVRNGEYALRARLSAPGDLAANVDVVPIAGGQARSSELVPSAAPGWIEAPRPLRLHPGAYRATFALPLGAAFEALELAPRCIAPVEPLRGWQAAEVLDAEDLAVTLVRAVDRERELAPAALPQDVEGSAFSTGEENEAERTKPRARLVGGIAGGRALAVIDVPEDGLYALSAFGVRTAGQRWAADDCRTAVTCPQPSKLPTWAAVMALRLSAGRHRISVELGPGDSVERLRLERKKDSGRDYVEALSRMGFEAGSGPVSREKAQAALDWLRVRHRIELGETCWELGERPLRDLPGQRVAQVTPPGIGGPSIDPPPTLPCVPPSSPVVPNPCPTP